MIPQALPLAPPKKSCSPHLARARPIYNGEAADCGVKGVLPPCIISFLDLQRRRLSTM